MNKENNEVVTLNNGFDGFKIFSHPDFSDVRTKVINHEPWFVGRDVATALGYTNTRKAIADHVDDEDKMDGVTIRDSIGREQTAIIINESGVYSLTFSSKLPSAKQFKRWVTSEVLPALRKSGTYSVSNPLEQPLSREEMAMYWTNLMASYQDYSSILERRDKSRDEKLDTLIDAQTKCYSYLNECVKTMSCFVDLVKMGYLNTTTTTTTSPAITSPSTKVKKATTKKVTKNNDVTSWLKNAEVLVKELSKRSGIDVRLQSREIYDVMRTHGHKVIFKPGTSTLNTISKNKKLREGFDAAMEELNKKYKNQSIPRPTVIHKVPDEIKDKIKVYAEKKNLSYTYACGRIYKAIEFAANVSLDKMCRDYSAKLGLSSCNKAYMIQNNNELLAVFNKIIND